MSDPIAYFNKALENEIDSFGLFVALSSIEQIVVMDTQSPDA